MFYLVKQRYCYNASAVLGTSVLKMLRNLSNALALPTSLIKSKNQLEGIK